MELGYQGSGSVELNGKKKGVSPVFEWRRRRDIAWDSS